MSAYVAIGRVSRGHLFEGRGSRGSRTRSCAFAKGASTAESCVSTQWWAHLVGALRVHPHKHYANHPPQKDRGTARGGRDRRRQSCGSPMAIAKEACYIYTCGHDKGPLGGAARHAGPDGA